MKLIKIIRKFVYRKNWIEINDSKSLEELRMHSGGILGYLRLM